MCGDPDALTSATHENCLMKAGTLCPRILFETPLPLFLESSDIVCNWWNEFYIYVC